MTLLLLAAIATLVATLLVAAVVFATHVTRIAQDRPLRSPQSHRIDSDFLPPSRLV